MEKPILFNTEMVKAILEGRKTQTRRAIKNIRARSIADGTPSNRPPCQPGDVLYVRETWSWMNAMDCGSPCLGPCKQYKGEYGCFIYKATNNIFTDGWNPSIHMPREAARLFLKVKDVRLERLQEISDEDAIAEGANCKGGKNIGIEEKMRRGPIDRFAEIWNSTLKPVEIDRFGWAENPWVWVIEFERCEKPEGWY